MSSRNLPETVCFWMFILTWPFYLLGALYLVGPILAWSLAGIVLVSAYLGPAAHTDLKLTGPVPGLVILWCLGMVVMLVALWIGHLNWSLGATKVIKSSVGWAKGWAMIALLIAAGALLRIRRESIIRSQCIVGTVTLGFLPLLLLAPTLGLPPRLFVSPLQATGGPGPEYFSVYLYTLDPATWTPRWQFYAPWSPFAGLLGVTMTIFAIEDRKRFWKLAGIASGLAMIYFSKSRMSLVSLAVCIVLPRLALILHSRWSLIGLAGLSSLSGILGAAVWNFAETSAEHFRRARIGSTRVRETLQDIAYHRWNTEAYWFGHGTVERGPHIVEYMPIGSHHTWYGLLFVKGFVGFAALLVPLTVHAVVVAWDAMCSPRGRLPCALMLNSTILTFGENLEIEVYLLWPAFLMLGVHLREMETARRGSSSEVAFVGKC
jgi:hypothetical protein